MGFWSKKEKYNPSTERFEKVEREPLFKKREPSEVKELTREEQIEPKRLHPWQTPRGKRVISGVKKTGKRLDRAVVSYNRQRNPMRGRGNYNPFGSMFDTGMKTPSKKRSSGGKSKYIIRGGKAYPVVKTGGKKKSGKKKKRSRSGGDAFSFDFGSWGY